MSAEPFGGLDFGMRDKAAEEWESPPKAKKRSKRSHLEDALFKEFQFYAIPAPERQFRFHPTRRWAFDFAWPDRKIAIEISGGIFMPGGKGGHNRGAYMEETFDKQNQAVLRGWRVFTFGPKACRVRKRTPDMSAACKLISDIFESFKRRAAVDGK